MQPTPRITFANLLRGLACLLVVVSHFCGFWVNNHGATNITHLAALDGYRPSQRLSVVMCWFCGLFSNTPNFGVLLFFLISGFVIPISLQKIGSGPFLVQRFFRLFPTYWAALALMIGTIVGARLFVFEQQPALPFDFLQIVHNALLTKDFAWEPSIEMGIWTLLIEIKFYLLAAFVYSLRTEWRWSGTLALVCCGSALMIGHFNHYNELFATNRYFFYTVASLTNAIPFMTYMLLGVVAQQYWSRRISISETVALTLGIYGLWLYLVTTTQYGLVQFSLNFLPSLYAVVVFWICLGMNQWWNHRAARKPMSLGLHARRLLVGLEGLSSISYPLYLVHATLGYSVFCLLWHATHLAIVTIPLGTACIVGLAVGLHYFVELPSIAWGKWLSERCAGGHVDRGETIAIDPTLLPPPRLIRRRKPQPYRPFRGTDAA